MEITNVKQSGFINDDMVKQWKVKVYGIGSIGSILIHQLALLGFKDITGYDFDTVDDENIGSQLFDITHIGMKKTEAIQSIMKRRFNYIVNVVDGMITEETEIEPEENTIYFCAFDSLEARNILWNKIKNFPVVWGETRTGRTAQRYYFVDLRSDDQEWVDTYQKSLDVTGPRIELKCGEKGCFPSNAELVSKVCRQIVNIAEDKPLTQLYIGDWGLCSNAITREPVVEVPITADYLEENIM